MSEGARAFQLAELVVEEARLLDAKQYDAWFALFADDAHYWIPLSTAQTDPLAEQSIAYEDKLLLNIRLERLRGPRTYSHQTPIASQHVLQAPRVVRCDEAANFFETHTPFLYVEARGDAQIMLAGVARHRLRLEHAQLRIVEKRIDLLNAGAPLPTIYLII